MELYINNTAQDDRASMRCTAASICIAFYAFLMTFVSVGLMQVVRDLSQHTAYCSWQSVPMAMQVFVLYSIPAPVRVLGLKPLHNVICELHVTG